MRPPGADPPSEAGAGWHSYDRVAEPYERLWAPRFERAAQHLLALIPLTPGGRLLDIGTGTGAVPVALGGRLKTLRAAVGCDLSLPMLSRARRRRPRLRVAAADAVALPFRTGSFDVVTASFVLSHVPNPRQALREARRVLRAGGAFVASDWLTPTDPYEPAWRELLAARVGADALRQALAEVTPSHFGEPERFCAALGSARLTSIRTRVVDLEISESAAEFLAGRELSAGGRFGHQALGAARWDSFRNAALARFRTLFGDELRYTRGVVLAAGVKPGPGRHQG